MQLNTPPAPTKPAPPTFFMLGTDDRPADTRPVALAIALRCDIRVGDREFSCPLNLHEIAIYRRFYEARGGGAIRVSAGWPPGLHRVRALVQSDLAAEVKRLAETCIIPREGQPPRQVFAELFGTEPAAALTRFAEVMRKQRDAWEKLVIAARARVPTSAAEGLDPRVVESMAYDQIIEKDLDLIINIADPTSAGANSVALPEVTLLDISLPATTPVAVTRKLPTIEETKAIAEKMVPGADDIDGRIDSLVRAGLNDVQAMEAAALIEDARGDADMVLDEQFERVAPGKLAAIRAALK